MISRSLSVRKVGKYEVGRTLGEGTFAKVKFARNTETDEPVALKVLDKEKILKHRMVEQIKREISIMKLVRHPNVVRLHEVLASRTKIYIVLEFITGGELFDKIVHQGRLDEKESRMYFQQLVDAVEFCHSRGVYHRDLKPENLLLDAQGNLKISDFGLSALPQQLRVEAYTHHMPTELYRIESADAKKTWAEHAYTLLKGAQRQLISLLMPLIQDDGLLHTTCGTPNYVAPEVLDDRGYSGAKADLWSCGVILYVIMAGYLPFDEADLVTLYKKIHKADFHCPKWFSSEVRQLVRNMLDPNPKTRMSFEEIRKSEWFKKDYKPAPLYDDKDVSLNDVHAVFENVESQQVEEKATKDTGPEIMNAFELISLSQGLNLSPLFEERRDEVNKQTRFMTRAMPKEVLQRLAEAGKELGFTVQARSYRIKMEGSQAGLAMPLSVTVEVFEVSSSMYMVEVRKAAGDVLEYHKFYKEMLAKLDGIVYRPEEQAEGQPKAPTEGPRRGTALPRKVSFTTL